mmetsp:Transcript_27749/g.64395  ORF Transcript_27749/g.64395 Transcript_27749/m.64395 type:complete len:716 (-) Transcript_27749:145-2292(-)
MGPKPLRSVPVGDDPSHRVRADFRDGGLAKTPRAGIETLYDLTKDAIERYGERKCMGSRNLVGWKVPGKVKHFGDEISWKSFSQMGREAHKFGAALRAAGMIPAPDTTNLEKVQTPSRMAIFENTCAEWMTACIGAFTQSITVTTIYATLGMDAVAEAVVDNIVPVIVCNKISVGKLCALAAKMPSLKVIVYTSDQVAPNEKIDFPEPPKDVRIVSFEDFVASGDCEAFPPTPPKANTAAVVMYTSGSTSKPKGVMITHGQVIGACAGFDIAIGLEKGKDSYLAYLPCAHILELAAEFVMLDTGCTLCYADPRTLTTTGSYPIGALEAFSPTIMAAVPKIWDVIKKGISAKVAEDSAVVRFLFNLAFAWRTFALKHGFDTPLFNALVFRKLNKAVGGKLRYALSGGGPLNKEVHDFCRTAFGIIMVQGYVSALQGLVCIFGIRISPHRATQQGLTETCAGITIQARDDLRGGVAGVPIASVEVKLGSTPDVRDKAGQPYLSTDHYDVEGNAVLGRGEVVVRGTNVTSGYYMMNDKTREVYGKDGWFYTGDIGQFLTDGSLCIVDRKKNLVKLLGGEYIALEKMEMTYGNSDFVDARAGGICCYGDGEMDRPVALLQLNKTTAMKYAEDHGLEGDYETIKHSPELYKAVMESMKKEHAKSDLSHLEKLVAVALLTTPWTPENGCLTAANKLQRRAVVQHFDKEFDDLKAKGIFGKK